MKSSSRFPQLLGRMLCLLLIINGALVDAKKPQTTHHRPKTTDGRASVLTSVPLSASAAPARMGEALRDRVKDAFGKLPLRFEENRGQAHSKVKFISRGANYSLFLSDTEAILNLTRTDARQEITSRTPAGSDFGSELVKAMPPLSEHGRESLPRPKMKSKEPGQQSAVLRMRLVNANPSPRVSGRAELPHRAGYYLGNHPKNWADRARNFENVEYKDVYPGIGLIYHGNQGQLEYDFTVAPGADPRAITLVFSGADDLRLDQQGALIIRVGDSEIRQHKPVIYQERSGIRELVSGHYLLKGSRKVGFQVDNYDPTITLVIDPVITFGTYLGGGGTDSMFGLAVDDAGNVYTAGFTTSLDFPSANALQPAYGGGTTDIVVSKLNPDLSQLLFSTYLGGSGDDRAFGLDVDRAGNAYLTGFTSSPNFPTRNAMQPNFAGIRDIFAVKLDGAGALVYSTYIGRNGDDRGQTLAVDAAGNVAIAGLTSSATFPMLNAFQPTYGGNPADVFVLKLNAAGSALLYSSYLGGMASAQPVFGELANGIRLDSAGHIYLTGFTEANNFPTKNAVQTNYGGGTRDVFLAKFDPSRTGADSLVYSTYLGGNDRDEGNAVTVDSAGNAYVTGFTFSNNFPTLNAGQAMLAGGADMFVSKVSADGRSFVYSTYLGGTNNEQGTDIEVDQQGNALVVGGSTSSNFPKAVPLVSAGATGNLPPPDCGFGFVLGEIISGADGSIRLEVSSSNTGLTDTNVNDLTVAGDGLTVYTAADSGVFKSTDGGLTWTRVYQTAQGVTATAILIGTTPDEVFVGLGRSGTAAFASIDEGRAANTDGYVLRSANGGRTFEDFGLSLSVGLTVERLEEIRAERAEQRQQIVALFDTGNLFQRNVSAPGSWQQVNTPGKVTHVAVNSSKDTGYAALLNAGTNSIYSTYRFDANYTFSQILDGASNVFAIGTGNEPGDLVAITQTGNATTLNTSTDYGRNVAQVQILTPPGSNEFHGTAFWNHRNDTLNANTFFNTTGGLAIVNERGEASRTLGGLSTSGFRLGGPIASGRRVLVTTRFGESQFAARFNQSGILSRTRCIPADGNSNNSRIFTDPTFSYFEFHGWTTQGKDHSKLLGFPSGGGSGNLIGAAATPFQPNNRGGVDNVILALSSTAVSVSAASYTRAVLASEAIVAAFGQDLATATQVATTLPLPTQLAGTTIRVRDSAGVERTAQLFFVSPAQINYLMPPGMATGTATVTVASGDGAVSFDTVQIATVSPGLFTANASGQGVPAAAALRVKADGSQSYEPVARFDAAANRFVSVPIDFGPAGDQVFLLLFGTGWRGRTSLAAVTVLIGGIDAPISFAGAQGDLVGLDQLNAGLPRSLAGRGEVDLTLRVDGQVANTVRVSFK